MKIPFVDLTRIHNPIRHEIKAVLDTVLDNSSFVLGGYVEKFEEEFATYIGTKYCAGCANGTDAIELTLEGLGVGSGDEVIVPNHTWISTASAIVKVGATPILVDTLYDEYTINPVLIEQAITPKTKAILLVHLFGLPCQMEAIMAIAKKHNLLVIEDCAQAHGATYKGQRVGSFGHAACFSFYPSKNLGALGDGGAITTNCAELNSKLKMLINCGQSSKNKIEVMGRNSRLDAFQAAVLSIKLKQLDKWNAQRRQMAFYYFEYLKDCKEIELPIADSDAKHVFHLYVIKTKNRELLSSQLNAAEIGYGIHYPFMLNAHLVSSSSFSTSESYSGQIISLPIFAEMKKEEVLKVAEIVRFSTL